MHSRSGIYMILDTVSGRRYIGSAVNINKRWKEHRRGLANGKHHSKFMQRCWRVRPDAFRFEVMLYCARENLLMYEQIMIDGYRPEFNTSPTAGSQLGLKMSDEAKAKMRKSRRKDFSPMTGKKHTDETKAKISKSKSGVKMGPYSQERKEKTAKSMRETKNAITIEEVRLIRKWHSEGQAHKFSAMLLGRSYWAVADVIRGRTMRGVE